MQVALELVQLMTKPRCEASPRLQWLLLKVTQYRFNTIYVKHNGVSVADCFSWNVTIDSALKDESLNVTIAAISMIRKAGMPDLKGNQ